MEDIESNATRDLLGPLGSEAAHSFASLAPGLAVLMLQFQSDVLPYFPQGVVDRNLDFPTLLVPLGGVVDGVKYASDDGDGGFQGFGHSMRVGRNLTPFKTALDATLGIPYGTNGGNNYGPASSKATRLTPTGPCPSGRVPTTEDGPDTATPTSQAGPNHQDS